ncbi:hypothetical protein PMSD_17575 [Paenibacillus macquariensis subsp. defensor]|nr:hypothetical protein PMSD_17575 [Paenibacillus macquariensis subsp. defensor]
MMENAPAQHILFQADPNMTQQFRQVREHIHHQIKGCIHRTIRVQTINGCTYEGVLMNVEGGMLFLSVPAAPSMSRAYNPYYNNVILPLVLFELLVIVLLM